MREDEQHMNTERFQTLLAAYGAEPLRWPENERAAAVYFAGANSQAAHWIAEARQLDTALGLLPDHAPSQMLRARVLQSALLPRNPERPSRLFASIWQPAIGMAASLLFGIIVGTAMPGVFSEAEQSVHYDLTELAFNSDREDIGISP